MICKVSPMAMALTLLATAASAAPPPDLATYVTAGGPGLAIGIVAPGASATVAAAGLADLEVEAPFRVDTPMHAASVTKQFTGASIALLEAQGRLARDDDVRKYLPWVPEYGPKITLRHLLEHTSGLRSIDALFAMGGLENSDPETRDRVTTAIRRQTGLNNAPGETFIYGNTGYFLLGEVVAAVTGRPFSAWTRENLFLPLGMKDTRLLEDHTQIIPGRAIGYEMVEGRWTLADTLHGFAGPSNLHTTAPDLARWAQALMDGRGPAKPLHDRLRAVKPPTTGLTYAYGVEVSQLDGQTVWDHGGQSSGYSARVFMLPDQRRGAVTLSNGALDFFRTQTLTRALGSGKPPPRFDAGPARRQIDPKAAQSAEGLYRADTGVTVRVWRDGAALKTAIVGIPGEFEIVPDGEAFAAPALNATLKMDRQDGRPAQVLDTLMNGQSIKATRIEAAALAGDLQRFEGEYFNCDLQTLYVVRRTGDGLELSSSRFDSVGLMATEANTFIATLPMAASVVSLSFEGERGQSGSIRASTDRARNLRFERLTAGRPIPCPAQ